MRCNAAEKKVTIAPRIPDKWNEASLENVRIGDNTISVFWTNGKVRATQTNPEWEVTLHLANGDEITGKGEEITN